MDERMPTTTPPTRRYKKWKTYLRQKNDVERDFREQKLQTEENIKTRAEVQEVLADMERQARLVQLEIQVSNRASQPASTDAAQLPR